jgi:hypothetical protein
MACASGRATEGAPQSMAVVATDVPARPAQANEGVFLPWGNSDTPGCALALSQRDGGWTVLVDGKPTPYRFEGYGGELRVHPYDSTHVAFALYQPSLLNPELSDTLWLLDCAPPFDRRVLLHREAADLGSSALSADRRFLFFTEQGVRAMNLSTGEVLTITDPPLTPNDHSCWIEGVPQLDRVLSLKGENDLWVARGGPCGFEGDFQARRHVVEHPLDAARRKLRPAHPTSSVVVDAAGQLWVGDAGLCRSPGIFEPGTRGMVWRSRDAGESFERMEIVRPDAPYNGPKTAVSMLLAASGVLFAKTRVCEGGGIGYYGGNLYRSLDGGKTWEYIAAPPRTYAEGEGDLWVGIEFRGDKLQAHRRGTSEHGDERAELWELAHKSWTQVQTTTLATPNAMDELSLASRKAVLGQHEFQATDDGLFRITQGASASRLRVFPKSSSDR